MLLRLKLGFRALGCFAVQLRNSFCALEVGSEGKGRRKISPRRRAGRFRRSILAARVRFWLLSSRRYFERIASTERDRTPAGNITQRSEAQSVGKRIGLAQDQNFNEVEEADLTQRPAISMR